jgi:hypothetical protein
MGVRPKKDNERPAEERRHEQPWELALQGDGPAAELEERWIEPRARWSQWCPGERLTFGELVVVEKHLDKDVLAKEPDQEKNERAPVPADEYRRWIAEEPPDEY